MDIPNLDATFQSVWRVLKPGGWFAFLITHPCFATPQARPQPKPDGSVSWEITRYFEEGFWRDEESGNLIANVGAYHRTFSTYLNSLISAGFAITHMVEPQRTDSLDARNPGYSVVPLLMMVRCIKYPCE